MMSTRGLIGDGDSHIHRHETQRTISRSEDTVFIQHIGGHIYMAGRERTFSHSPDSSSAGGHAYLEEHQRTRTMPRGSETPIGHVNVEGPQRPLLCTSATSICQVNAEGRQRPLSRSPDTAAHPDQTTGGPFVLEGRQRLICWLEEHVNRGQTPGLAWIDRDRRIFKVPWRNVSSKEWTEKDGAIFKLWAIHTGRYEEGVDEPDWPTWKTRFRCALNRLPGIKKRKDFNKLDIQEDEMYRAYQFVDRNTDDNHNAVPRRRKCNSVSETSRQQSDPISKSAEKTEQSYSRMDSGLKNIKSGDLIKLNSGEVRDAMNDMDVEQTPSGGGMVFNPGYPVKLSSGEVRYGMIDMEIDETRGDTKMDSGLRNIPSGDLVRLNSGEVRCAMNEMEIDANTEHILYIMVKYRLLPVLERRCSNPRGCRIFFDKRFGMTDTHENPLHHRLEEGEDLLVLPQCSSALMDSQQQKCTLDLLNAADKGVTLHLKHGNIFATRKCRCRIYISAPSVNNGDTIKLDREKETKIFDLEKYFKPALGKYIHQTGQKPSPEVIISFGQNFKNDRESINSLLVSASVIHMEAYSQLTSVACNPLSQSLEFSSSLERQAQPESCMRNY